MSLWMTTKVSQLFRYELGKTDEPVYSDAMQCNGNTKSR